MSTKVPLEQVVIELLDGMDRSSHYFRRLYRIGVRGCRKFNSDIYGSFRSVLLDVSANHSVAWPCDYLDYSTLGIINGCGEVVPLKHNENLSLLRQQYLASQQQIVQVPTAPSGLQFGVQDSLGFPFFWLNYNWGDTGWVHLYGYGGGAPAVGEFTVDVNNRCFYVPHGFPYSTVMLEYLTDGYEQEGDDYMVDIFAVEAIQWWIRWMDRVDTPKKWGRNDVAEAKREYVIQARTSRLRINHARINEMQAIFREKTKLAAKA